MNGISLMDNEFELCEGCWQVQLVSTRIPGAEQFQQSSRQKVTTFRRRQRSRRRLSSSSSSSSSSWSLPSLSLSSSSLTTESDSFKVVFLLKVISRLGIFCDEVAKTKFATQWEQWFHEDAHFPGQTATSIFMPKITFSKIKFLDCFLGKIFKSFTKIEI